MEPNPQVTPTLRYAAVVVPNYNGGEKRLVPAALMETCMTKTRQESPGWQFRVLAQVLLGSSQCSDTRYYSFMATRKPSCTQC